MKKISFICTTLLFSIFLSSCVSTEKLVDQGDYDRAIQIALRKLAGKKNKKTEHVQALEEAFAKVTDSDLRKAARLKADGQPGNWGHIYDIYRNIRKRQERIEPLLPIIDKHGIKANFKFVNTLAFEKEAKQNAAEYHYSLGVEALRNARQGDRLAARDAFQQFQKIDKYYRDYKDKTHLMDEAAELGVAHILIRSDNQANVVMPAVFENALMDLGVNDLNGRWRVFHIQQHPGVNYHYEVNISLTNLEVSPSLIQEKLYQETREIEDGFDYVLDDNGNVMKDSLGNDIKVARKVIIAADVIETFQHKAARVDGYVEFFDAQTKALLDSKPFGGEAVFEHYAATFEGDRRALSDRSQRYCQQRPLPFPTEESLILEAAQQVKPLIRRELAGTALLR